MQHEGNLEKEESAPCPYCDYKSKKGLYDIKTHIDFKHQFHGTKEYFCDVCIREKY